MVGQDGDSVEMVSVGGSRSILAAIVAATKAEMELGGQRFILSEKALANCRGTLEAVGGSRQ
jgi:hypothetical protein